MRSRWSVQGGEHAVHPALTCGEPPVVDVLAVSTEALGGSTQLLEIDITRHRHHAGRQRHRSQATAITKTAPTPGSAPTAGCQPPTSDATPPTTAAGEILPARHARCSRRRGRRRRTRSRASIVDVRATSPAGRACRTRAAPTPAKRSSGCSLLALSRSPIAATAMGVVGWCWPIRKGTGSASFGATKNVR